MIVSFRGAHAFLSNFYPGAPFVDSDGVFYRTMEHWFQYKKAEDPHERKALNILEAASPKQAKYWGRAVTLRPDWEAVKLQVMRDGLAIKFSPESEVGGWLVNTHPHVLQEGNDWGDTYWGVVNGRGQNWLGVLLMARRAELLAASR